SADAAGTLIATPVAALTPSRGLPDHRSSSGWWGPAAARLEAAPLRDVRFAAGAPAPANPPAPATTSANVASRSLKFMVPPIERARTRDFIPAKVRREGEPDFGRIPGSL